MKKSKTTNANRRVVQRSKSKKSARKVSIKQDRLKALFIFIENLLRSNPDILERQIISELKKKPLYNFYREKGKDADIFACQDIRRIRQKIFEGDRPVPPNEVIKFPLEQIGMTKEMSTTLQKHCKSMAMESTERLLISASVMEQLYLMQEKSILNFPCASGKTTAAIALAATYASRDNRMWVVTQKVQDVCRIAEELRKLGCNALEWHGYNPSLCHIERERFISQKNGFFCRTCDNQCTAKHKYLSRNAWDYLDCDVLVTTHSHWQATVNTESFHETVGFVIVDEAPSLMEYFSLNNEEINRIHSIFNNRELSAIFNTDIQYIRTKCEDGGCYRIPQLNTLRKSKEIIQYIHKKFAHEDMFSEDFELIKTFLNFFSSTEIYAMLEKPEGKFKLSFIRGDVDIRTKVPHMVLDGSALMSDSFWEGFTIYECDALEQTYPNTRLDILNVNPSKSALSKKDKFERLHKMIIASITSNQAILKKKSPIVVFQNKELKNDKELKEHLTILEQELNDLDLNIIDMCRGEHIGSNKAKDAVLCAIAMSLFNNVSYYVLRTALVNHCDIQPERIWKRKFYLPHMKRNGGFCDYDIQKTYCRALVVDLYQTIMRGCVRVDPEAEYNVICTISGPDIIHILHEELPGASFNYDHAKVIDAIMEGKNKKDIQSETGILRTQLDNLFETLGLA